MAAEMFSHENASGFTIPTHLAAAALVVGRALPEPTSRYGSVALCERSDRWALTAALAWLGVVQTPWSREPRPTAPRGAL
jgi:hypothetical protein